MASKKTAARETIWEPNPATKVDDFSHHCKTRASYYCSGTVVTLFSIIGIKIIMLAALFTVYFFADEKLVSIYHFHKLP